MANPNIVSVSSILGGNAGFNLSNTLTATLITVDAEKLVKINRITCANVDGSSSADLDLFIDGLGSGASGVRQQVLTLQFILQKPLLFQQIQH